MIGRHPTEIEVDLFQQAKEVLLAAHHPKRHQVAAALRTETGGTYVGLHVGSRRVNVCAEASAIANAMMADPSPIVCIVAVCKDEQDRVVVTNPCGLCRELMGTYGPDTDVLVDVHGEVRVVTASELMPLPWMFPHENDWTVAAPEPRSE